MQYNIGKNGAFYAFHHLEFLPGCVCKLVQPYDLLYNVDKFVFYFYLTVLKYFKSNKLQVFTK